MAPTGKGFYIWDIRRVEAGNVNAIANVAVQSGIRHVLIKIADGDDPYNVSGGIDLAAPLVQALTARGVECLGWHYVYGYDPGAEADMAIRRVRETGVTMYVIDAEAEYKLPGRDTAARQFMSRMRAALPTFPMALSSYRYPTYHPQFPFQAFLEKVDINMPQVYWVERHDPGAQLTRCLREFEAITPFRPIIPTGSAYVQGSWQPTANDIYEFMNTARTLNMAGANFWEWGHTRLYLPNIWDVIAGYSWPSGPSDVDIVTRYIAALNTRNLDAVMALYDANAIHVTGSRTLQGTQAIRGWYQTLFAQTLPGASFTLTDESGQSGSRRFTWTASSTAGDVTDGEDSFGLAGAKIVYHFTSFTVER